nr:MAG TPA: hypothetical protein [Caudoviricetes sp.]
MAHISLYSQTQRHKGLRSETKFIIKSFHEIFRQMVYTIPVPILKRREGTLSLIGYNQFGH